jgi:membrane protease subunit (stomatin/prohibitin family)
MFKGGGGLGDFIKKQFIDVIDWVEPENGILAWRYPMQDMEIQNGAKLTVRESQMAAFVNEGRMADVFAPGLYTLNTQTLPLLTNLMNWDKLFQSPFKSDVYFFSTRAQLNQRWGTANPLTVRDKEFGAVRIRGNGVYSWHLSDPRTFHTRVSGTREIYKVSDLEGQLRDMTLGHMADAIAQSGIPFLDLIANQVELGKVITEALKPLYLEYGLSLDSFFVREFSLPEELQEVLDKRIGMNMVGDMNRYMQYNMASSIPTMAANEGSGSMMNMGANMAAGIGMGQMMSGAMQSMFQPPQQQQQPPYPPPQQQAGPYPPQQQPYPPQQQAYPYPPQQQPPYPPQQQPTPQQQPPQQAAPAGDTKFCMNCGSKIPRTARFCADCGTAQQ